MMLVDDVWQSGLNKDDVESDNAIVLFGIVTEDDIVFDGLYLMGDGGVDCVREECVDERKAAESWDVGSDNNEDKDETGEDGKSFLDRKGVSLGIVDGNKWTGEVLISCECCRDAVVGERSGDFIWSNRWRKLYSALCFFSRNFEILSLTW